MKSVLRCLLGSILFFVAPVTHAAAPDISIAPAVDITVPTEPNLHYEVQITSDLANSIWVPIALTRRGYGLPLHFTWAVNPFAPAFFRVVTHHFTNDLVGWYPFDGSDRDEMPLADMYPRNYEIGMTNRLGAHHAAYDSFAKTNDYPFTTFYHPHRTANTNFTISFWFKSTYIKFLPSTGPSTNAWIETDLRVRIVRSADDPRNLGRVQILTPGSLIPNLETPLLEFSDTEWRCAQLVRNGSTLSFYIDGGLVGESQTTALLQNVAFAPISFSGAVDDIRLYSRALSLEELSALRQSED